MSHKRVVTSAIEGMSVSKVRRGLDTTRRMWRNQNEERPFFISNSVVDSMTMQHFALKFVMGHHYKRHNKSTSRVGAAAHNDAGHHADHDVASEPDDNELSDKETQHVAKKPRTRSKK